MKVSDLSTALLLLILGGVFWVYEFHPEALQDAWAEITKNPKDLRSQLAHDEQPHVETSKTPEITPQAPATTQPPEIQKPAPELTPTANATVLPVAATYVPPDPLPAQPNWTWATTDGKIYKNVIIKSAEADCVTLLDDDGGARVDMGVLSPDLQKLLNYNPALAQKAREERQKNEALAAKILQRNLQQKHEQLSAAAQDGPSLTSQEQAQVNISSAQSQADRLGQIAGLQSEIASWEAKIQQMQDVRLHNFQDFNALALKDAEEKVSILNIQLTTLKQQAAAAEAAAASSP